MDWNEIYMLLHIAEKAHAFGGPASQIRASAMARLAEIEKSLIPVPPDPVYPEPDAPVDEEEHSDA